MNKDLFRGIVIGLIFSFIVGFVLFDNYKIKLRMAGAENILQQVVNVIQQSKAKEGLAK